MSLAQAHAAGIVHFDLKPENIMVGDTDGEKIVDFGIAKLTRADELDVSAVTRTGGTATGMLLGTVGYMSPEQASGRLVDHRSDQFSLGLIADEAVTGRQPFARPTAAQTLTATIEADPEPVNSVNPDVPPHLALVIHRCLEKNSSHRYESTRDLARDLQHVASAAPAAATARGLTYPHPCPSAAGSPFCRGEHGLRGYATCRPQRTRSGAHWSPSGDLA